MTNKQRDVLCSAIFLAFGAVMFALSFGIRHRIPSDVGSGYVPKFIALCIMVAAGAKLILSLLDKSATGQKKDAKNNDLVGGLGTIALMLGYMFTFEPVGFLPSSIVYLFLQMLLMSNKDNRKPILFAIISVALPVAVYLLFNYVMKMPLPRGILNF